MVKKLSLASHWGLITWQSLRHNPQYQTVDIKKEAVCKAVDQLLSDSFSVFGAAGENRTHDLFITSELLYP